MLMTLAAGALAALALTQQSDTTVAVSRGMRLEVDNFAGEIAVRTWDRDAVRISAAHSRRDEIQVESEEGLLSVGVERDPEPSEVERNDEPSGHERGHGPSGSVNFDITAPSWMPLELNGVNTDVRVAGARSEVTVETVEGSVDVDGGSGSVSLSSVQGTVGLRNARGRIDVSTVNAAVRVSGVSGDLTAATVNDDIVLDRVKSGNVEATTVNGAITYDGAIEDGGRYSFSTHNGAISVAVPEGTNATVFVATFKGEFRPQFPVSLPDGRARKRFDFVLGSGGARLELESFQGPIELRRPGRRPEGES